ncbi:MAG: hypothetical protein ISS28_04330 [Candidatus Cloacimonetes bacterium]|nr:hypothetical protein [Candidatus Cloacimonadota bacterium]MBL7086308.1 hypothetical protein [Candidatus Cloacimonadota bacterium]
MTEIKHFGHLVIGFWNLFVIYNLIFVICGLPRYVLHYNFKYKRRGTLFQGPLQHIHVKNEKYLICLCKYIHYNPKKANLVDDLTHWEYSNYLEWVGKRNGSLYSKELIGIFPDDFKDYSQTILEYEKYINERDFIEIMLDY